MANYYASARSNYFRVKDINAFKEDCPVRVTVKKRGDKDYCLLLFSSHIYSFPDDVDEEDPREVSWTSLFAKHLEEDSVAIFMEAGSEKLCYISGYAFAYNSKGEELRVSLDYIYDLVNKEWNPDLEVTLAEY